jgi:hypothetical protein
LPFPSLLKLKSSSSSFLSHSKTYKNTMSAICIYWRMMNLDYQSFTNNLFVVTLSPWLSSAEWSSDPLTPFHSQHVLLERESNRKSFVDWITLLLTTLQN